MELQKMIEDLIKSGILENEELALTLLRSKEVSLEDKRKAIDGYIKDFISGKWKVTEEKKKLFDMWVKIYLQTIDNEVKNRIIKI